MRNSAFAPDAKQCECLPVSIYSMHKNSDDHFMQQTCCTWASARGAKRAFSPLEIGTKN